MLKRYINAGVKVEPIYRELLMDGEPWVGTLLQRACELDHHACARTLISAGADIEAKTRGGGKTALHYACRNENVHAVAVLLDAGAQLETCDSNGDTPEMLAQKHRAYEAIEAIEAFERRQQAGKGLNTGERSLTGNDAGPVPSL